MTGLSRLLCGLSLAALLSTVPAPGARAGACFPEEDADALAKLGTARVTAVTAADTLALEGGSALRLAGVLVPAADGETALIAAEAQRVLSRLVLGKEVRLFPGETPRDRYGRFIAQILPTSPPAAADAAPWVQGALVGRGLARVYTRKESRTCAAALFALETAARAAKRGLWALPAYAVRSADAIPPQDVGSFQLVEGIVRDVAVVGGRTYLNFGADWRTDFTVTIAGRDRKLFAGAALMPGALEGRTIRVRGFIEGLNGPMIVATHPEQVEELR